MGFGRFEVSLRDGVFVCRVIGHVGVADSIEAQAQLDRLAEAHPEIDCTLYDAATLESFDPGLPMRWIAWGRTRARKSRRVAFVGRMPMAIAVFATLRYLIPSLTIGVFEATPAAVAFLKSAAAHRATRSHGSKDSSMDTGSKSASRPAD